MFFSSSSLSIAGNTQNSWGKLGNIFMMRVGDQERMT